MRVDLITGFLGAGKTTFIRHYLEYLQKKGDRIRIIENEFGSVNVDLRMLQDMSGEIDDLAGCCMCCTGKDRFISMIVEAAKNGYDRVLVEPSWIYDVDEFFSVMEKAAERADCEIGSILTIVDAAAPRLPEGESAYLMYAQLLSAGEIVLSKTQLCDAAQTERCAQSLKQLVHDMDPEVSFETPFTTAAWDTFTDTDYARFEDAGYYHNRHNRNLFNHQDAYATFVTLGNFADEKELAEVVKHLFEDAEYGKVLRVKGYMKDREKNWYEVNCTENDFNVKPAQITRGLAVVVGQDLNEEKLKETLMR